MEPNHNLFQKCISLLLITGGTPYCDVVNILHSRLSAGKPTVWAAAEPTNIGQSNTRPRKIKVKI